MDYISHNISVNLKKIRLSKGMSLDVAAEQTGVSKSMLYQIEKGDANPSISVLGKIASGLRIGFNELIASPKTECCLVKVNELIPIKELPGQYSVKTCFPYEDNKKFEIYRIDIRPGGVYTSGGHGEKTREYICILDGELTINANNSVNVIRKDDIFRFETESIHIYSNNSNKTVSFICVFMVCE